MQTEHAVCWDAEFLLAGKAEVVWVLWQVPSQGSRAVRVAQSVKVVAEAGGHSTHSTAQICYFGHFTHLDYCRALTGNVTFFWSHF